MSAADIRFVAVAGLIIALAVSVALDLLTSAQPWPHFPALWAACAAAQTAALR